MGKKQKIKIKIFVGSHLDAISNDEPAQVRISQSSVDEVAVEVTAGLDGDDHAGLHDPGRAERTKSLTFGPGKELYRIFYNLFWIKR